MSEAAVAGVRYRWRVGWEARALIVLTWILLAWGLATVHSASAITAMQNGYGNFFFVSRQLAGIMVGMILFAIAAKKDAQVWEKLAWPLMIATIVMLALVIMPFTKSIAPAVHGSRRFLFGRSIQPSEIAKLAVIVWTAMLLVKKGDQMRHLSKGLLPFLVVIGLLDILVVLEPDLSVAMMYTLVMGIILFAGGVRIGHFVALGIFAIPVLWNQIQRLNYVLLRMTSFITPDSAPEHVGYQLKQSLIAVGSGQITGVGFGRGRQQYGFLPFAYDDFIGGTIGEEFGFIGLTLLILLFAAYAALGFRIAKNARTPFLQYTAIGITATTVITAYLHIGVAIGLLPTTGLTLPFISYGRSNLVLTLLMTGILVNIGSNREKVHGADATNPTIARSGVLEPAGRF